MPQNLVQKTVNTFIKGLITEAGELTFPPDASVDESNCDLSRDGSRSRRLGADREASAVLSSFTITDAEVVHVGDWKNVGGQSGLEYLVVQKGTVLYFYNKATSPYSNNVLATTVDLTTYEVVGSIGVGQTKCQFTSINGTLIVASEAIDTIYVERDNATEVISVTQINFRMRDFEWIGEKTEYETGDSTPSVEREYDTQNAGWVGTKGLAARSAYSAANGGDYPPLTHPWYSGKDATGNFDAAEWAKIYSGSSLLGNGHFILNPFNKDRGTASGLAITAETEDSRFKAVEAFGGRVFYSGLESGKSAGLIFFSRQIQDVNELGECLQQNDPTSEDFSDLLPTDGGVIQIPDAVNIKILHAMGSVLVVFAENGIWTINGVDGVFKATEYSVKRASEIGIASPESFISAGGTPIWWSRYGIHTLSLQDSGNGAGEQDLSTSTIQTFWDSIPEASKEKVQAVYDEVNKTIYWAWPDAGETVESKVNNFLILDLALQAFYPWTVSDEASSTDCIVGLAFYSGYGAGLLPLDVITAVGDDVVTSAGDDVVSFQNSNFATGSPTIVILVRDGATNKLTMGGFVNQDFLDSGTTDYSSYAVAGYEFFGDLVLKKTSPYITPYMRVTETGWTGSEVTGYDPVGSSSLLVSSFWDFGNNSTSTPQQAYRLKIMPVVDPDNLNSFNYPDTVITSRLKLRGRGRSVRLKFESEQGKDFVLLGYSMIGGVNGRV
jgi:hypothetical protein